MLPRRPHTTYIVLKRALDRSTLDSQERTGAGVLGQHLTARVLFRHALGRPMDALSLGGLCDLQCGTGAAMLSNLDRARLLASLRQKPDFINVQVAPSAMSCPPMRACWRKASMQPSRPAMS